MAVPRVASDDGGSLIEPADERGLTDAVVAIAERPGATERRGLWLSPAVSCSEPGDRRVVTDRHPGASQNPGVRRYGRTPRRLRYLAEITRGAGLRYTASVVRRQLWDTRTYLGLRCSLAYVVAVPPAQVVVEMIERDIATFGDFERELDRVTASDAYETLLRIWSCHAGVESLFVAEVDRQPVYCQWLVRANQQAAIDRHSPGSYSRLASDEVLLEGAYTFTPFRGKRAMAAGMAQLLHVARNEGATAAITYVAADNVPSLKGCARVGFELDHRRVTTLRLGRRRSEVRPVDDMARAAWALATG